MWKSHGAILKTLNNKIIIIIIILLYYYYYQSTDLFFPSHTRCFRPVCRRSHFGICERRLLARPPAREPLQFRADTKSFVPKTANAGRYTFNSSLSWLPLYLHRPGPRLTTPQMTLAARLMSLGR